MPIVRGTAAARDNPFTPATTAGEPYRQAQPQRKSRALSNANAIPKVVAGKALIVGAALSVLAFWQGDVLSGMLDMYLDDARLWPVDGLLAVLGGLYLALKDDVRTINKIRFAIPAIVYGANSIYTARVTGGAAV